MILAGGLPAEAHAGLSLTSLRTMSHHALISWLKAEQCQEAVIDI